jgi:hypothetical protein
MQPSFPAYEAPQRPLSRVLLVASNSTDPGFDHIEVVSAALGGANVHIFLNSLGEIEWGLNLEKAATYPKGAEINDLVIMLAGLENSPSNKAISALRALLPVINAVHGNSLLFTGLAKHHARLGIDRFGTLVQPALQPPLEE